MRAYWFAMSALLLLAMCLQTSESLYVVWKSNKSHGDDSFHIPMENMLRTLNSTGMLRSLERYKSIFGNKSLDERCARGLPLSIAWHLHSPYTSLHPSTFRGRKGFSITDMFPNILKVAIESCCHKNSTVTHGKLLQSVRQSEDDIDMDLFDFTFPLYGNKGGEQFREHSFISVVEAPRVILLVHDNRDSQTQILFHTIMRAWPMLLFILVTASLSGIIIWFLDHSLNPEEFPPPFLRGAWEGFWWALVTMTTVGYGDRSPKSALGRVFCILWILTGVVIVAIFTALITASLSASTVQQFVVHGSKIGAVNGSQEYQLGVKMNAQMEGGITFLGFIIHVEIHWIQTYKGIFPHIYKITEALLKNQIDGALVDNYVVAFHVNLIQKDAIRVERYIDYKIPYGVVLAKNSPQLEKCMRRYMNDHPQEVFEKIASNLIPLKNPIDYENRMLKAAEGLFYEENLFSWIMYIGLGIVVLCFLVGVIWEFAYRRPQIRNQHMKFSPKGSYSAGDESVKLHPSDKSEQGRLDDMISEYQMFHDGWIEKLKKIRDKNYNSERTLHGAGVVNCSEMETV